MKSLLLISNLLAALAILFINAGVAQELIKVPFPYGPLGLKSLPWIVAKEARLFEKNGLDVDMVYIGASAVMVQSMLSGSATLAGFGGPAVVTNVLRGGDIIQVAAMAPHFTQSLIVRPELRDLKNLQGKKIGITRFGSVTDFALRTVLERHNLKDVNTLQMGGFPEAVAGLSRGVIDGAMLPARNGRRSGSAMVISSTTRPFPGTVRWVAMASPSGRRRPINFYPGITKCKSSSVWNGRWSGNFYCRAKRLQQSQPSPRRYPPPPF